MSAPVLVAAAEAHRHELADVPWQPTLFDLEGDPTTLDDLVSGAWEGVVASGTAPCPVCGERLVARRSADSGALEGRCRGCGSVLS